jgi:hypothetical protein
MHNECLMICQTKLDMVYYGIYVSATKVVFEGIQLNPWPIKRRYCGDFVDSYVWYCIAIGSGLFASNN